MNKEELQKQMALNMAMGVILGRVEDGIAQLDISDSEVDYYDEEWGLYLHLEAEGNKQGQEWIKEIKKIYEREKEKREAKK